MTDDWPNTTARPDYRTIAQNFVNMLRQDQERFMRKRGTMNQTKTTSETTKTETIETGQPDPLAPQPDPNQPQPEPEPDTETDGDSTKTPAKP